MESMCRRYIRYFLCFMTVVMTALIFCSSFFPFSYVSNGHISVFANSAVSFSSEHESLQPTGNQFLFTAISAQFALQEIKPAQRIAGRIRNYQGSLQTVPGVWILSLTSLLLYIFAHIIGKKNKHLPVISFFIGGHAPPSHEAL